MDDKIFLLKQYNLWNGQLPDTGFIRNTYIDLLWKLTGNRLIKVLTGQRRVGKSYLLRQIAVKLINEGIPAQNIFMLNKEMEDFSFVKDDNILNDLFKLYLKELKPQGKVYIFLDEIQNISGWEHFVNSCSQDYMHDYEVFISGSNSKMLSGQLATLLSGRYVKIEVYPFSYGEYAGYSQSTINAESFSHYLHSSGMPELFRLPDDETRRYYISSLKDTILLRDIIEKYKIRDITLLESLFVYLVNNASNLLSVNNIVKYMKGQGRKVSYETIASYIQYMEDAYLLHHAERYNIKGRNIIGGPVKYYMNDLAFRNYLYKGFGYGDGYLLENGIFIELKRQGFDIYTGNVDEKEVDFIAIKSDRRIYVQATFSLQNEETARREYASLENINDSFEKYVVSMDTVTLPLNQGIRHVQAWDFGRILRNF